MQIQPYLFFDGRCDEAIAFYASALGASVRGLMRFKEGPAPHSPATDEKVMHAEMRIGQATVLVSDGKCGGTTNFQGFALTLLVASQAEAEKAFAALCDGGKVQMPLAPTFFSPKFGMVEDRFGVLWMVYVAP